MVRRTSSVGQNCDMYTIRLQINQAFQEADKDGSGHLSKQELLKVLDTLNITLQNPVDDMDVIFGANGRLRVMKTHFRMLMPRC